MIHLIDMGASVELARAEIDADADGHLCPIPDPMGRQRWMMHGPSRPELETPTARLQVLAIACRGPVVGVKFLNLAAWQQLAIIRIVQVDLFVALNLAEKICFL